MIEYYTEVCNSFRKEPEIFSIRQTYFLFLLCLLGITVILYMVAGPLVGKIGNYLAAASIALLVLVYIGIRAAGDKLTLGYIYKRISYPKVPKYIKGSSIRTNRNHDTQAQPDNLLPGR
jgi:hypothetical protein